VVKEIRIYIEGDSRLRVGFGQFLDRLRSQVREKRIRWEIILCGSRIESFDNFKIALETHLDAFNVLLVDAEERVDNKPWAHLKKRDDWQKPNGCSDDHCHLMEQAMEAWFLADLEALEDYYGQGFNSNPIPRGQNVEEIEKDRLISILQEATKHTSKKAYHKVKHASSILGKLREDVVRSRASHCERFFAMLEAIINPGA
jgi:Domain of unknown function (DUF4276)